MSLMRPIAGDRPGEADDALPYFSYSAPEDGPLRRLVIRTIEHATGQPRLKRMYLENHYAPRPDETFWQAAIRHLGLQIHVNEDGLAAVPTSGPLVVVANHPYGVLDGIVLSYLTSQVRPVFKILTNSVLYRAPELQPYLLPIDFAETREAIQTNLRSRAEARDMLRDGHCVVAFPGGTVSTAPKPFQRAVDPEWKPFTARLILEAEATVLPVFFAGQNSQLFQLASKLSQTLRLSLLFKEVADRINGDITLRVGQPIPYTDLQHITDRRELSAHLRALTYDLGRDVKPVRSRRGGKDRE